MSCEASCIEIRAEHTLSRLKADIMAPRPLPHTSGRVIVLPGDHDSIMEEDSLGALADAVDEALR
jgi:hypothetical protein